MLIVYLQTCKNVVMLKLDRKAIQQEHNLPKEIRSKQRQNPETHNTIS